MTQAQPGEIETVKAALKRFSLFSSSSVKYEEASELYEKAGNQYKIAKKCTQALLRQILHAVLHSAFIP